MNVTSNHLDVAPFPEDQHDVHADPGEELSKRGEYFGHPVGKSKPGYEQICFLVSHNYNFTDDANASPILICKIRKGQELKAKCIAKKVGNFSIPSGSPHQLHRVSPKSMPSGLRVLPWLLNMTLTISYGIHPIGLKPM